MKNDNFYLYYETISLLLLFQSMRISLIKIFEEEKVSKQLQEMFDQLDELKKRAEQSIFDTKTDGKEKKYFLSHLLERISRIYDDIVKKNITLDF